MLHVRRSAAWLLLAAAFGGPAAHRAAHGLEREALRAEHAAGGHHAADGHHVAGGSTRETGEHLHETCTTRAQDGDLCTLCQSAPAGGVAADDARADAAPDVCAEAVAEVREHSRPVGAATGRGSPEGIA